MVFTVCHSLSLHAALPSSPTACRLLRPEDAVAGVAQAGHDVALVVQLLVDRGGEDGDVGVGAAQLGDALRGGDQADEADLPRAVLLQPVERDRKSTRLNSTHYCAARLPSSA